MNRDLRQRERVAATAALVNGGLFVAAPVVYWLVARLTQPALVSGVSEPQPGWIAAIGLGQAVGAVVGWRTYVLTKRSLSSTRFSWAFVGEPALCGFIVSASVLAGLVLRAPSRETLAYVAMYAAIGTSAGIAIGLLLRCSALVVCAACQRRH